MSGGLTGRVAKYDHGNTVLQTAARRGDKRFVGLFLGWGAAINALDNNRETALFFATLHSHKAAVKMLLRYGADVTITNPKGWTALMLALQGGHVGIEGLLLSKGAVVSEERRHMLQSKCRYRLWTRLGSPSLGETEIS